MLRSVGFGDAEERYPGIAAHLRACAHAVRTSRAAGRRARREALTLATAGVFFWVAGPGKTLAVRRPPMKGERTARRSLAADQVPEPPEQKPRGDRLHQSDPHRNLASPSRTPSSPRGDHNLYAERRAPEGARRFAVFAPR